MPTSRRSFLIGSGALITAAFVKEVQNFVGDSEEPLLLRPQSAQAKIYYEWIDDYWQLSLGEPELSAPPPPLLIEHLTRQGVELGTQRAKEEYCLRSGRNLAELQSPMDGFAWEDTWEHNYCPASLAYDYLRTHNIFPDQEGGERAGRVSFVDHINPACAARIVQVHDALSLSLLQARLTELRLDIALEEWSSI